MTKQTKQKKQGGFSIIEMIIVIFILTLISILVVNFQLDIFSLNRLSSDNLNIQTNLRQSLKTLTAEIRSAIPSTLGAYPLVQTSTSSLVFYTNTDSDTLVEKVRYFLDGQTFKKGTVKPTGSPLTYNPANESFKTLADNVTNSETAIFDYYNTDYDGTSPALSQPVDSGLVRLIKVTLIIDEDVTKLPPPVSITTQVTPRNIKDNL
jgi:type II secretory pathway pseudopilin PulG